MIEYPTGRVEFERHQDGTLTAEFRGDWFYVKRVAKGQREFVGTINGKETTRHPLEKEVVFNLVQSVSGW